MWVGLLFSLMCLAVQYQQFSPDEARRLQIAENDPENLIRFYREKTIQCLVLSKYSQGPRYTVETFLLYLFIESLRGEQVKSLDRIWVMWGDLIRIAFRAGYHRDGSNFPVMSCFEAERRRRVWTILVGWDLYLSVQVALPCMINPSLSDTTEPRSLLDEDLYEHMLELPTSRPDFVESNPNFHVARNRLLGSLAKVNDLMMLVSSTPPYSEVLRLDNTLTSTYESIIPSYQPQRPSQDPLMHSPSPATISVRHTFLSFIYYRAQIVLHRRYMSLGRNYGQYAYSRKVSIEAALAILKHQWVLYLETQVGGQLCRHGWKFLILLVHDFLFATSVLCAELGEEISFALPGTDVNATSSSTSNNNGIETRDRVFHALSSSYIVWLQSKDAESSSDIRTVVSALKHLLGKAQEAGFGQATMVAPTPPAPAQSAATSTNTGVSGSTPVQSRPEYGIEAEKLQQACYYWGLAHFPI